MHMHTHTHTNKKKHTHTNVCMLFWLYQFRILPVYVFNVFAMKILRECIYLHIYVFIKILRSLN